MNSNILPQESLKSHLLRLLDVAPMNGVELTIVLDTKPYVPLIEENFYMMNDEVMESIFECIVLSLGYERDNYEIFGDLIYSIFSEDEKEEAKDLLEKLEDDYKVVVEHISKTLGDDGSRGNKLYRPVGYIGNNMVIKQYSDVHYKLITDIRNFALSVFL